MTHRDKARAQALEYARSQGWRPPHEVAGLIADLPEANSDDTRRIAALLAQLTESQNARGVLEASLSDARGEYAPLSGMLEKAEGKIAELKDALRDQIAAGQHVSVETQARWEALLA